MISLPGTWKASYKIKRLMKTRRNATRKNNYRKPGMLLFIRLLEQSDKSDDIGRKLFIIKIIMQILYRESRSYEGCIKKTGKIELFS